MMMIDFSISSPFLTILVELLAQQTDVEAVAHFPLVVAVQFATEKGGNISRFAKDQDFQETRVERCFSSQVYNITLIYEKTPHIVRHSSR